MINTDTKINVPAIVVSVRKSRNCNAPFNTVLDSAVETPTREEYLLAVAYLAQRYAEDHKDNLLKAIFGLVA
jgi:hypothetical protein